MKGRERDERENNAEKKRTLSSLFASLSLSLSVSLYTHTHTRSHTHPHTPFLSHAHLLKVPQQPARPSRHGKRAPLSSFTLLPSSPSLSHTIDTQQRSCLNTVITRPLFFFSLPSLSLSPPSSPPSRAVPDLVRRLSNRHVKRSIPSFHVHPPSRSHTHLSPPAFIRIAALMLQAHPSLPSPRLTNRPTTDTTVCLLLPGDALLQRHPRHAPPLLRARARH